MEARNIYLTEKQFDDYIKFSFKKYGKLKNNIYRKKIPHGYGMYKGDEIGLPFNIYINETGHIRGALICYVFDNEKKEYKGYEVRYNNKPQKNEQDEYMRLFINNNLELLYDTALWKTDMTDFFERVVPILNKISEWKYETEIDLLTEMSTLSKRVTGLKTNLWVDEGGTYKKGKHWQRIKFDPQNGVDKTTRDFPSITISDKPELFLKYEGQKIKVSDEEINKIKQFVSLNKENLLLLGDGKIRRDKEFIPKMITFDKDGNIKNPVNDNNEYHESFTDKYGYTQLVTRDKNGQIRYNFTKANGTGTPYCEYWFDSLTGFFKRGDLIVAYGIINNIPYDVYTNGTIRAIREYK